ncbi:MAG: NHL repeat-containing protein [Candidatus Eremiobacteraeota bacterium]|nr:NHL repeat-containing protein [Candidatus Eremiobacteraeota bacterium]MBV8366418.1 NHL repeat-containing protein [Candidatus Eremiobacteraeota bacterium]
MLRKLPYLVVGVALLASACSSSSTSTSPTPGPQTLYVGNCGSTISITEYPASATGNVAPTVTIAGAATLLQCPEGLAFDSAGTLYVADYSSNSVIEFAPGASGNATPVRQITGLSGPVDVAFDSSGNLYVGQYTGNRVDVFAPLANGAATPIRSINTGAAGLLHADYVHFDTSGNLWVSEEVNPAGNHVVAYAPGASGNATPVFSITGANTQLSGALGMTLDSANNIYVSNYGSSAVTVYAAGSNGNVAPIRTVSGALTQIHIPYGIAFDNAGNYYVANCSGAGPPPDNVAVFPSTANGNVAPARDIAGAATGLSCPWGITLH